MAILADTHMPRGRRRLPDRCRTELEAADLIIHLGDFSAASVLAELRAFGKPVHAVHGNTDDPELRAELPAKRELELGAVRLGLLHDAGPRAGRPERLQRAFPGADAVLFAHSHLPLHERRDGFQMFNPGSPTERRRAPAKTMGIGEIEDRELRLRLLELEPPGV